MEWINEKAKTLKQGAIRAMFDRACTALEHPELSEQLCAVFARRRNLLLDGLSEIDGIVCPRPEGAFYAFPDISAVGLTSQAFCELLLERKGVVCIPGSAFGACGRSTSSRRKVTSASSAA